MPVRVASFIPVWTGPGEWPGSAEAGGAVRRVVAFFVSLPVVSLEMPMRSSTSTMVVGDKSRRVARMLDSFFKTQMLPSDLVAIARADSASIEMLANFGDERKVLEAAGARSGTVSLDAAASPLRVIASPPEGAWGNGHRDLSAVADHTTQVLLSVDRLISVMEALPGRRMLFVVGGLRLRSSAMNPGVFAEAHKVARSVIEHANRAEVTLFGIDPSGLDQGSTEGLEELADGTGGSVVGRTEMLGSNLGRILTRNLGYYSLGYEPRENSRMPGQKLRVRVNRKEVKVTARPIAFVKGPSSPQD